MRKDLKQCIQCRDLDKLILTFQESSSTPKEVVSLVQYAIHDNYWQAVEFLALQLKPIQIEVLKQAVIALASASEWTMAIGLVRRFADNRIYVVLMDVLLAKAIKNGDAEVLSTVLAGIMITREVKINAFIYAVKRNRRHLLSFFVEPLTPQAVLVIASTQAVVEKDDSLFNDALFYLFYDGSHKPLRLAVNYRLTMLVEYLCALPDYHPNKDELIRLLYTAYKNEDSAIVSALINKLQPIIEPVEFLHIILNNRDTARFKALYPSPLTIDTLTEALTVLASYGIEGRFKFALSLMREGAMTPALTRDIGLKFASNGRFFSESDKDLYEGILQNPSDIEAVLFNALMYKKWDFIIWFAPLINKEIGLDNTKISSLLPQHIPDIKREAFDALYRLLSPTGMTFFPKVVKHGRFDLMPIMFMSHDALRLTFESHLLEKVSPNNDSAITHIPDTVLNVTLVERLCRSLSISRDYSRLKHYIANLADPVLLDCLRNIDKDPNEDPVKWEIIRLLLPKLPNLFAKYICESLQNNIIYKAGLSGNYDIAEMLYIKNLPMMGPGNADANPSLRPLIDNNQIEILMRIAEKIKKIPNHESCFINIFQYVSSLGWNPAILALFAACLTAHQVANELNCTNAGIWWPSKVAVLSALTGDNKPSQSVINRALGGAVRLNFADAVQVLCSMTSNNKPSWYALSSALNEARHLNESNRGSRTESIRILEQSFEPNIIKACFFGSGQKRSREQIEADKENGERVDDFWESHPGC